MGARATRSELRRHSRPAAHRRNEKTTLLTTLVTRRNDRSFFVVTPRRDEPGSLVRLLQEFSVRGINLVTIESRPTRALLGEYRFLIECEGHIADAHVRDAVLGLLRFPGETRFLGSFPEDPARLHPSGSADGAGEAVRGYEEMLERVAR